MKQSISNPGQQNREHDVGRAREERGRAQKHAEQGGSPWTLRAIGKRPRHGLQRKCEGVVGKQIGEPFLEAGRQQAHHDKIRGRIHKKMDRTKKDGEHGPTILCGRCLLGHGPASPEVIHLAV